MAILPHVIAILILLVAGCDESPVAVPQTSAEATEKSISERETKDVIVPDRRLGVKDPDEEMKTLLNAAIFCEL